jgi:hypothetical protein
VRPCVFWSPFKVAQKNPPLLYSFRRCCTDVMAPRTDSLLTRLLILEAVPYSSESIFDTREI